MNRVAFFDLDGTIRSTGRTLYPRAENVGILIGVPERLRAVRSRGYKLVGITNQGGVNKGVIPDREVRPAIGRTQELLGDAALDLVLYCPHDKSSDGLVMVLDALTALTGTLDGAFVVGDDDSSDGGLAQILGLPFLPAPKWLAIPTESQSKLIEDSANRAKEPKPSENKVAGALVGLSIGDALGAPLEFKHRAEVKDMYPHGLREMIPSNMWRKGQYTDDTEMALLIADSLLANGELVPTDVAARFHQWAKGANDVGIQTRSVVNSGGYANAPEKTSRELYRAHPTKSAGNGAVMRCAPVALLWLNNVPMLLADSRRSARLTHGDPKAQSSCVLLNVSIREAILHGTRDARATAMECLTPFERREWVHLMEIESATESQIRSSGYTVHTVEAAFWSFLTTDSFEEAVVRAANLGDDADTLAAVTGALAGAYYGYNSIPKRWLDSLENRELLSDIASRLVGLA